MSPHLLYEKNVDRLDLTNQDLHFIPEEVFNQQHLKEVWLDRNHIKEISPMN